MGFYIEAAFLIIWYMFLACKMITIKEKFQMCYTVRLENLAKENYGYSISSIKCHIF